MFPLAGLTAGPNGQTFFVDTHGYSGGDIGLGEVFFLNRFKLHGKRRALQLVSYKSEVKREKKIAKI